MSHTPGPWELERSHPNPSIIAVVADHSRICTLYGTYADLDDSASVDRVSADAQLISSAPEILEALENLLDRRSEESVRAAQDAIAKAKGLK